MIATDLDGTFFGADHRPEARSVAAMNAAQARIGNEQLLSIPMVEGSRSLNLANAVAVVVYDTWRRHGYPGATSGGTVAEAPLQPPL